MFPRASYWVAGFFHSIFVSALPPFDVSFSLLNSVFKSWGCLHLSTQPCACVSSGVTQVRKFEVYRTVSLGLKLLEFLDEVKNCSFMFSVLRVHTGDCHRRLWVHDGDSSEDIVGDWLHSRWDLLPSSFKLFEFLE